MARFSSPKNIKINGPRTTLIDDGALFAQLCQRQTLQTAWARVRNNGGASGGDRLTIDQFQRRAEMNIGLLASSLKKGDYHPGPLRDVSIPKPAGGIRKLRIPCVGDRIAQTAVATLLTPFLEEEFEESSFGYRPGRSVQQAVSYIQGLQRQGLTYLVDADIKNYFDMISHDKLLERLAESMHDGPLSALIALWLSAAAPDGRGLAQGSPLSPLLANLYLDRLDEAFAKRNARIVRFADDFIILTANQKHAQDALNLVDDLLAEFELELNKEKTRVSDFQQGFRFLGHLFARSMALKITAETVQENDINQALAQIARQDETAEKEAAQEKAKLQRQEAYGYSPGFRTLYIMHPNRRLSLRNQAFAVEELRSAGTLAAGEQPYWHELIAVPHQDIDRIDIGKNASITEVALDHALATDTMVCFVDGHGATKGTLSQTLSPYAKRHLAQAQTVLEADKRLELARILVEGRVRNQRALLRKLGRERDSVPSAVTHAIAGLTQIIGRGDRSRIRHAQTIAELLGYEGAAGAKYWKAISALAHTNFAFEKRERAKPCPANIALNVLSWLLLRDVNMAVLACGLHPGFGVLHKSGDHHDACCYDLMEEFRAHMVEGLFVYLSNRRILRREMFRHENGQWRIMRAGMEALIRGYEARASAVIAFPKRTKRVSFRRLIVQQAYALVAHFEQGKRYIPFEIDY